MFHSIAQYGLDRFWSIIIMSRLSGGKDMMQYRVI